jgi:hypothetical protein
MAGNCDHGQLLPTQKNMASFWRTPCQGKMLQFDLNATAKADHDSKRKPCQVLTLFFVC